MGAPGDFKLKQTSRSLDKHSRIHWAVHFFGGVVRRESGQWFLDYAFMGHSYRILVILMSLIVVNQIVCLNIRHEFSLFIRPISPFTFLFSFNTFMHL